MLDSFKKIVRNFFLKGENCEQIEFLIWDNNTVFEF